MAQPLALLADIGGTNSRFALAKNGALLPDTIWHTPNNAYPSFEAALARYLTQRETPDTACIAAAGPVQDNTIQLTNHPWMIDTTRLPFAKAHLLNDLQAMGYALATFSAPTGPRLVLNIGTGLNAAVLRKAHGLWSAPAAELGYAHLPLLGTTENRILSQCARRHGAPVMEAVLSGASLPHLHHALTGQNITAADITSNWHEETLKLYLKVLGCYIGDLALGALPYGGIWLAGSLGRAIFKHLDHGAFRTSFETRGAYTPLMQSFAFHILEDETAALTGAALYLSQGQTAPA